MMIRLEKFNSSIDKTDDKQETVSEAHNQDNSEKIENIEGQDVVFGFRDPNRIGEDRQKLKKLIEGLKPKKT